MNDQDRSYVSQIGPKADTQWIYLAQIQRSQIPPKESVHQCR